jgi:Ni,Fe-hydrogenase III small subunit
MRSHHGRKRAHLPAQPSGSSSVSELRVDLWIPGCPPHLITVLDGLLRLLGRVEGDRLELTSTGVVEPQGR